MDALTPGNLAREAAEYDAQIRLLRRQFRAQLDTAQNAARAALGKLRQLNELSDPELTPGEVGASMARLLGGSCTSLTLMHVVASAIERRS